MAPASVAALAVYADSRAVTKTLASSESFSAPTRTPALLAGCSYRPPAPLVSPAHTLPPCTPLRCLTKHNCSVLFWALKVWWSTFRPPQTAAHAVRCGLLLLRRSQYRPHSVLKRT